MPGSAAARRSARSEQGLRARRQDAARSLWGWLPLAILIFWATYILTKYISFSGDGLTMPEYDVSVVGSARDPILADIGGKANAMTLRLFIPQGVRSLSIGSVAPGEACSQPSGDGAVPIRSGIWYDDAPFTDPADGQTVTGRRVQIDPAKQLRYGPFPLYGRTVEVAGSPAGPRGSRNGRRSQPIGCASTTSIRARFAAHRRMPTRRSR